MKKHIILTSLFAGVCSAVFAQSAISSYSISQPDLKGTARYMGMAGAFGALGGDLSAIAQNPGGIGVYRSSDIGFTLDLDAQHSVSQDGGQKYGMNQTKFYLNNIGGVFTLRLPSSTFPNLNFGFTYNKGASFNRVYGGNINNLQNSMSNFIAYNSNVNGLTSGDVSSAEGINPYDVGPDYIQAPWLNILAAQAGILTYEDVPTVDKFGNSTYYTDWYGLWDKTMNGSKTNGSGSFLMQESGGANDFNIVIGGNIADKLYWGMNFDIVSVNYQLNTYWGESLNGAYNVNQNGDLIQENADWNFNSSYSVSGTGFKYQLGLIFKPVQEFRLGFAFHTPTWYNLNEEFVGSMNYYGESQSYSAITNYGTPGYNSYNFRTPWKILASAAGVIGNNLIVSFDYEWANYGKMHISEPTYYNDYYDYNDPWWMSASPYTRSSYQDFGDAYSYENNDIANYYKSTNTFRVGLEFKPISSLSIRAGYAYVSSPVKKEVKTSDEYIYTQSLSPSYRFDNSTNYITCGLGYRYQHFYVDLAYVYKRMDSQYHAYTDYYKPSGLEKIEGPSPQSKVTFSNNQVVLSAGFRF